MIYYAMWRLVKQMEVKREGGALKMTTKVFVYAYAGLSSNLEIVSKISG